jgi:hypothetical protein
VEAATVETSKAIRMSAHSTAAMDAAGERAATEPATCRMEAAASLEAPAGVEAAAASEKPAATTATAVGRVGEIRHRQCCDT